jgi:hypothetical protein
VGLAPTGKRRLVTAHTHDGPRLPLTVAQPLSGMQARHAGGERTVAIVGKDLTETADSSPPAEAEPYELAIRNTGGPLKAQLAPTR